MRDIINATLGNDHFLKCSTYSIARNGEGLAPCLSISIPENLTKYWAYIDFKKANGETFKTPRIDVADGKIEYNIPHAVLDNEGKLEVQVIFQNENNEIWKSYVKEFVVRYSINATDDIPEKQDFITEAQKLLDAISGTVDSGGVVEFVVVNELPTEEIKNAIYLVPNGDEKEKNLFDEYIYINGVWELIGSAGVEVDLDEYVKNTDYATTDKAGIVQIDRFGGIYYNDYGIAVDTATISDITNRAGGKILDAGALDQIISKGITTNTETLTEEEKTRVQNWLGIGNSVSSTPKYELIETIETTESMNIDHSQEPNGKDFNFKAMFVRINSTASSSGETSINMLARGKSGGAYTVATCYIGSFNNNTSTRRCYAEAYQHFGYWAEKFGRWQTTKYDGTVIQGPHHTLDFAVEEYPNLYRFTITNCPANATVEIWGVRNNEN